MMERLEATFDRAVDASLGDVPDDELDEQLRKYLADAHAIEEQAETLLDRRPELAGSPTQLMCVAQRAGDEETVAVVERILAQEREAADRIAGAFDEALTASLESQGVATA
jgi:ferritin-like metal-binding protein YciE